MSQSLSSLEPRALERAVRPAIGPWSPDHLVWLVVANLGGLAMSITGWWVVSGSGTAHAQLGWLNLCVAGLVVAGGANTWWLARGWRVVCLARQIVFPWPPGEAAGWATTPDYGPLAPPVPRVARPAPTGMVVSGPGMTRYHRPGCVMTAGKEVAATTAAACATAGLAPCQVCRP
jgi:hypothetical protein